MTSAIGFVGLGVMGEPMCRNLARKSGRPIIGYDREQAPLDRLAEFGVKQASSLSDVAAQSDVIFLATERRARRGCLRRA